jgi:hypothetical protein
LTVTIKFLPNCEAAISLLVSAFGNQDPSGQNDGTTMNCRIPQRAPEIPCEPSNALGDDNLVQPHEHTDTVSVVVEGSARPEPTRGVKKTASLRRGAAAYAQLLQSAVKASIESQKDEHDKQGPPLPDAMNVENAALYNPSRQTNKRAFDGDMNVSNRESPSKLSTSSRKQRGSEEMEC